MKTVPMENAKIDACVSEAQRERVILTRNGGPIALLVGVEDIDQEQIRLGGSTEFWKLIEESRQQETIRREELERRLDRGTERQ
jgi:antitoxin (DNA-binding transcriptional repressor) of toxin-antitoxin stability system